MLFPEFGFLPSRHDFRVSVCTDPSELPRWHAMLKDLARRDMVAWDTETSGFEWFKQARTIGYVFGYDLKDGHGPRGVYFPIRHVTTDKQLPIDHVLWLVQDIVGDPDATVVGHNVKFDLHFAHVDGIVVRARLHDTMIMVALHDENRSKELESCALDYGLDPHAYEMKPLVQKVFADECRRRGVKKTDAPGYAWISVPVLGRYACKDGYNTLALAQRLLPIVKSRWAGLYDTEMKLLRHLERAEWIGTPIDIPYLSEVRSRAEQRADQLLREIHHLAQYPLKVSSDDELRSYLYEHLRYPVTHYTRDKDNPNHKSKPAVDERALKAAARSGGHATELIRKVLAWREQEKILTTYTTPIIEKCDDRGVLHTQFRQVGTKTGRLSSSDPNLQNIPSDDALGIRRAFLVPKGSVRIYLDFSQIELRVLAFLAQEPTMTTAFVNKEDIHTRTSLELFQSSDKKWRRVAKCFHPDTECLTCSGWKKIGDLTVDDVVVQATPVDGEVPPRLSWTKPTALQRLPNASGRLCHLRNEGMDLRVTSDHRMLVLRATGRWDVVAPSKVPSAYGWANAGNLIGGHYEDATLIRLAVATQADGSYTGQCIRFEFSKSRKIERFRALFGALAEEKKGPKGVTTFVVRPPLATKIRALLDEDKTFPWRWLDFSLSTRLAILDEFVHWDGHLRSEWRMRRFSTTVRKNADVLQAIAAVSGKKTRLSFARSGYVANLSVRDRATSRGGSLIYEEIQDNSDVVCLSVPSGFVLVRDGGVPVITGQCINFGLSYGMTALGVMESLNATADPDKGVDYVTEEQAEEFLSKFHARYPRIMGYCKELWRDMRRHNPPQFTNPFGRVRRIPGLATLGKEGKRAERQAVSSMIQGTAADIAKVAMVRVGERLEEARRSGRYDGNFILTVHDENQIDVNFDGAPTAVVELKREMENFPQFAPIDIVADAEWSSTSWADKKPVWGGK